MKPRAAPREHLEMPLAPSLATLERFPLTLQGILHRVCRTSLRFPANFLCSCCKSAALAKLQPPENREEPPQPMRFTESDNVYRGYSSADGQIEPNKSPFLLPPKLQRNCKVPPLCLSISGTQINSFQS